MTKFLAVGLHQNNPNFRRAILKANLLTGKINNDIYFTENLKKKSHNKIRSLSLDPYDTLATELYCSLQEKLKVDEVELIRSLRYLAAEKISAEADIIKGLIIRLNELIDDKEILVIKPVKLKNIIKQLNPKKTVKFLGYRTLDSMLKRESLEKIFLAISLIESKTLNSNLESLYKNLTINDLTISKINFSYLPERFNSLIDDQVKDIITVYQTASIIINPNFFQRKQGWLVTIIADIAETINNWLLENEYLDIIKFSTDFGIVLSNIMNSRNQSVFKILENQTISTGGYYDSSNNGHNINDLQDNLLNNDKNLSFWSNTDHLMTILNNQVVSFNIKDIALDLLNNNNFLSRNLTNVRTALIKELSMQYFKPTKLSDYLNNFFQIKQDDHLKQIFNFS